MSNNNILDTIKLLEAIKSSEISRQVLDDFITFTQCYLRSGDEINKILQNITINNKKLKNEITSKELKDMFSDDGFWGE
jgi:hypothetical protein